MSRALEDWPLRTVCSSISFAQANPQTTPSLGVQWRLQDERLNVHQFTSIEEARDKIEAWRVDYNARRPRSSLRHLTPDEFVAQRQAERIAIEVGVLAKDCSQTGPTSRCGNGRRGRAW